MKISFRSLLLLLAFLTGGKCINNIKAQSGRTVVDLSGNNWALWLDTAAQWQNDPLYTRPVNIGTLPVNTPTGGWNALTAKASKTVHLPATADAVLLGREWKCIWRFR